MRPSAALLIGVVELMVGAYPRWVGCAPIPAVHLFRESLRAVTRPVAARDYWGQGLRRYIATKAFLNELTDVLADAALYLPLRWWCRLRRSGSAW